MKFYDRKIIDEVAELGLPHPEDVVINHGSALVIRGIRPERDGGDIDACTCLENNLYAQHELGFRAVSMSVGVSFDSVERTVIARRDEADRFDLHRWDFSMHKYDRTGRGRIYLPELKEQSDQDGETGIWVARPEMVLLTKLDSGREKDENDITLILESFN
ncbi:hypothetical protein H6796_01295 [Candidatus Nomurabacteria bacterium]|nr:hypothetical protein [Candidatus Nomurabacteria bacterium]